MIKINRILVPTAFCKGSKAAYDHAQMLAEKFGGKIDLLHVVPTLKYFHESMKTIGYPLSLEKDVYPKVADEAEKKAQKDLNTYISDDFRGKAIIKIGPKPSEVILETSAKGGYDLIIMGTRSEDPLDYIIGTVTERVIRHSTIPVLSVPPGKEEKEFTSILVPSDYSAYSMKAIRPAIRVAASFHSKIILLHVRELYGNESDNDPEARGGDSDEEVENRLAHRLSEFLESVKSMDIHLSGEGYERTIDFVEDGISYQIPLIIDVIRGFSAHHEITEYANEHADLICLTTHGRSGIASIFIGSTAEKITKWATVPVVTTRSVSYKKK